MTILRNTPFLSQVSLIMSLDGPSLGYGTEVEQRRGWPIFDIPNEQKIDNLLIWQRKMLLQLRLRKVDYPLTFQVNVKLETLALPLFSLIRAWKTPAERFPKFQSVLRVIDRSDRSPSITARQHEAEKVRRSHQWLQLVDFDPICQ